MAAGTIGLIGSAAGSSLSGRIGTGGLRLLGRSPIAPTTANARPHKKFLFSLSTRCCLLFQKPAPQNAIRGLLAIDLDISPPFRRLVNCGGVRSTDPVIVPLVALEIVRSPIAGPLTPAATELCRLADGRRWQQSVEGSRDRQLVPVSTAEAEPEPARRRASWRRLASPRGAH